MNRDHDRYWLSLQQTVSRIVQELADGYDVTEVHAELTATLREENDRGVFARVHRVPEGTGDVDDEATAALVIFGLDRPHTKKANSVAADAAREFLARRGGQPRINKNAMVFLAPDVDRVDTLDSVLRRKMAWESVKKRVRELNLDQHNITVVESRLAQAAQAVADTIRETYKWVIVPYQDLGASDIELETIIMNGSGTLAQRVSKKAESTEFVLGNFAPSPLRQQVDRLTLWKNEPHIAVDTLCGYFTQYLYMPRVRDHDVLRTAIRHMGEVLLPEMDGFAYADGFEDGRYRGLTLTEPPLTVSGAGLIVDPAVAQTQIADEQTPARADVSYPPGDLVVEVEQLGGTGAATGGRAPTGTTGAASAPGGTGGAVVQSRATRFHAMKALDPSRPVRDISVISDEILTPLSTASAHVRITVDIESSDLEKLTPDQVAALKENLATLGFTDWNVE